MKLFFGDYGYFEAVKFPEENLILITNGRRIDYVYDPKYESWEQRRKDHITVSNYPDVSEEELKKVMGGIFPQKETDFMRLCHPSQLHCLDLRALLKEDYPNYMSDETIWASVSRFLFKSDICYKAYLKLRELFDNVNVFKQDSEQVLLKIRELSLTVIGRDIFEKEIEIIDGHDCSSYFWIKPVRVIDFSDTNGVDNVAEMDSAEISIEQDDVEQYLMPFLYKHYDKELEVNKKRNPEKKYLNPGAFDDCLTHNFYTYASIRNMLKDIKGTIDALSSGRENEFTKRLKENLKEKREPAFWIVDDRGELKEYDGNKSAIDDAEANMIIDFYRRLIYRFEYMMKVGKEKGYNLISVMGP